MYCLNAPKGEFLHMVLGVFLAKTCFIRSCINYEFTKEPKQDLEEC